MFALHQQDGPPFIVSCERCGTLSPHQQSEARQKHIKLFRTTLAEPTTLPHPGTKMSNPKAPRIEEHETDTDMDTGATNPQQPTQTTNSNSHQPEEQAPSQSSLGSNLYEDITDDDVEDDTNEFTTALKALDNRRSERWITVTNKLTQQESQTKTVLAEISDIKLQHRQKANRANIVDTETQEAIKIVSRKQDVIIETLNAQDQTIKGLQESLVQNLEAKLTCSLDSFKNQYPTPNETQTRSTYGYASAAAQPARPQTQAADEHIPKYTAMERRSQTNKRSATQTNGNLIRTYVRDWRSEPVGKVERALRQEIAEWQHSQNMEDEANQHTQIEPDVDAIRHVKQFGSPAVPMMEIACVPEKSDIVLKFLHSNGIETWKNINPFLEQSIDVMDNSPDDRRYRTAHFTRLLLAWWKAANFVQSRDTYLYYQRLINAAFRSPEGLHEWPKGITGISIDAHGISDSKANRDIQFEYEVGVEPPPSTTTRNEKLQIRSLATGGTRAPLPAQKRLRQARQETEPNNSAAHHNQVGHGTAPAPDAPPPTAPPRENPIMPNPPAKKTIAIWTRKATPLKHLRLRR